MIGTATARQHTDDGARPAFRVVSGSGGGPPARRPIVDSHQLALAVFIVFEVMMFFGLASAYVALRNAAVAWPPPDMPRLPIAVTLANSGILLFSAYTMWRARGALRSGDTANFRSALVVTAVLGVVFLAVQGSEWAGLMQQGMTLSSGAYGGTFYLLIGLHAVHVAGAVLWLCAVMAGALRGRYSADRCVAVRLCATYWYFVCALWVGLFPMVYW
jgi:heme/copper-type cytochrome/quinol oxidase subunit 3